MLDALGELQRDMRTASHAAPPAAASDAWVEATAALGTPGRRLRSSADLAATSVEVETQLGHALTTRSSVAAATSAAAAPTTTTMVAATLATDAAAAPQTPPPGVAAESATEGSYRPEPWSPLRRVLVVAGGESYDDRRDANNGVTNDVWLFDVASETWQQLQACAPARSAPRPPHSPPASQPARLIIPGPRDPCTPRSPAGILPSVDFGGANP